MIRLKANMLVARAARGQQRSLPRADVYCSSGADFNNRMIALDNHAAGCDTTYTLDRQAARKDGFTLLRN